MKENLNFILIFGAMMATIIILHGCSHNDLYFRGDCEVKQSTFWGITLWSENRCSMPSGTEVKELTGHPRGEHKDYKTDADKIRDLFNTDEGEANE